MPKKIAVFAVLTALSSTNLVIAANKASKNFYDVPQSHWAHQAVQKVADEYKFMQGDPNGNFGGSRPLTRYEFAKTMSKVIEHYNTAIETNKQDTENLVSVMELFQKEMKSVDERMSKLGENVDSQNATIAELNELILGLTDEISSANQSTNKTVEQELVINKNVEARLALAEEKINSIKERGFLVDTLLKGTARDIRKLGKASVNVGRRLNRPGGEPQANLAGGSEQLQNESVETQAPNTINLTKPEPGTIYQSQEKDNLLKSEFSEQNKPIAFSESSATL